MTDAAGRPKRVQAKHWCFTINNYTAADAPDFTLFSYLVIGKEVGADGTPHMQGYCCFPDKKLVSQVKKIFPRAHLEVMRGTPLEASVYCKKDGDFIEHGELPLTGSDKTKKNWELIRLSAQEGKLMEIPAKEYVQCYSSLKKIAADHSKIPANLTWTTESPNEWIYGPPGTGKSHNARTRYPDCYLKMNNKWWENYLDEEVVLIEDVGLTHLWMGDFLKIWADKYGFRGEVKHSTAVLRPKKIIVTSNYHPSELWADPNVLNPLLRRFQLFERTVLFALVHASDLSFPSMYNNLPEDVLDEISMACAVGEPRSPNIVEVDSDDEQ